MEFDLSDMCVANQGSCSEIIFPLHTLLYVEDNPANLLLVQQLISRRHDSKLLTAISGDLGILLAQTCHPSVILMDINLPGMDGFEALRILRNTPATKQIPVIALSSNAFPNDIVKGIEAGFFRYLTKPYLVTDLLGALDLALRFVKLNCQKKANYS